MTVTIEGKHKAVIKRRVLTLAAKMSRQQINKKINELLSAREARQMEGIPTEELEEELSCWAEFWLRRPKP